MTDDRPNNHLLLSVWLLGVAYGHGRPAGEKAKTLEERDVHREAKELWRGIVNGTSREAVQWFDSHGAQGIGQALDAVDAALASVRATARDRRSDELAAAMACARTADDRLAIAKRLIAEVT
jgi:hypothetical protein